LTWLQQHATGAVRSSVFSKLIDCLTRKVIDRKQLYRNEARSMATSDFLHRAVQLSILMAVLNLTGCLPSPTATPLIQSPPLTVDDTLTVEPTVERTVELSASPLPTDTPSPFDHALDVPLPASITAVDISPDESRIAVELSNGLVVLDTASLEEIWATPVDLWDPPEWSPDGTRIAAFDAGALYVWEGLSGDVLQSLMLASLYPNVGGENNSFTAIEWSPDSTMLAVSIQLEEDGNYSWDDILWDPSSGEIVQRLDTPQHPVYEFLWSTDGTRLAAQLNDHVGFDEALGVIWEIPGGQTVTFTESIEEISDDLSRVVLGHPHSLDCELWDVASYTRLAEYDRCPSISPDFRWGAQAAPGHVELLDLSQAPSQIAATIEAPLLADEIHFFFWSPDGSRLAVSRGDMVSILDLQARSLLTTLQDSTLGTPGELGAHINWLPDNQRIITTNWDRNHTAIWHVETGERLGELEGFEIDDPFDIDPLEAGPVLIHTANHILIWGNVDAGVPQ
jgi:WD40 repeat protein